MARSETGLPGRHWHFTAWSWTCPWHPDVFRGLEAWEVKGPHLEDVTQGRPFRGEDEPGAQGTTSHCRLPQAQHC